MRCSFIGHSAFKNVNDTQRLRVPISVKIIVMDIKETIRERLGVSPHPTPVLRGLGANRKFRSAEAFITEFGKLKKKPYCFDPFAWVCNMQPALVLPKPLPSSPHPRRGGGGVWTCLASPDFAEVYSFFKILILGAFKL